jgi:hypothetical protein
MKGCPAFQFPLILKELRSTVKSISKGLSKRTVSKSRSLARVYFSETEESREK